MIQANELRIGNLVTYKGEVQEVWQLRNESVCFHLGKDYKDRDCFQCIYLKGIEPIPITEECFLKFGLYDIGNKRWRFNNYVIEHLNNMYVIKYISMKNEFIQIGREIKYVHDLQNVVFAHTGKELTLSVT